MASLFGSKPKPIPVATMPDLQSPEVLEARRRKLEEDRQRGGRESTFLSDNIVKSAGKLGV